MSPAKTNPLRAQASSWLVRNFVYPVWARRDHPAFPRYYREFERVQFAPLAEIQKLQLQRLRELLTHAHKNCAFYRERMDAAGLNAERLSSLDELSKLPVLTKRDIQEHGAELQAANFPEKRRVRNQTGGSTGSPLQFYVDKERFASRLASTVRHNRWADWRPGDWHAVLWGSRLDLAGQEDWWARLRNQVLYRSLMLNTSRIEEKDWTDFIAKLRAKRPRILLAYTQAAVLFAQYLRQRGIEDITFDAIVTTAEVLLPGQREFLEKSFQGKVFNRYGCREVSVMASECEHHTGMHVAAESFVVEIVPNESIPSPAGRVVITDLLNYSMPLIRYEIGDVSAWAAEQNCPCGRKLPLITEVQGRITEFLVLKDGRHISGPALTLVVADMSEVRQVQFVQKALDRIVIRVVPGKGYGPKTAEELRRRLSLYVGSAAALEVQETESIASEISGKYRFAINEMNTQRDAEMVAAQREDTIARR